jgi:hypothetical protein
MIFKFGQDDRSEQNAISNMEPSASVTGVSPNDKRWKPSNTERASLLKSAGYQCAICRRPFKTVEKPGKNGKPDTRYIAEAAHMYPHSDHGERGTPASRPPRVNDVSNMIMLCQNCHAWADYPGVGGKEFPLGDLRVIKREHAAWVEFMKSRTSVAAQLAKAGQAGLPVTERGQSVSVWGKNYRLPLDNWPGRVDTTFLQERSPEGDAMLTRSYAYAETGAARHAWLRRIDALDGSPAGSRWRGELADEATLLAVRLPHLPGLPRVLGLSPLAGEPFTLVTSLPSAVCLLDRYGSARTPGSPGRAAPLARESVRALLSGLPTLCAALGALHDAQRAHGDLDPQAILVDSRGHQVLRDLGRAAADGTPAGQEKPTKRSDVRRLAAILYELVTGVPPLTGDDGPPVPAAVYNPAVSEQAAAALTQALTGDITDARTLARRLGAPGPRPVRSPTA